MLLSSVEFVLVSITNNAQPCSSAQTVPTPRKLNKAIALIPKKINSQEITSQNDVLKELLYLKLD